MPFHRQRLWALCLVCLYVYFVQMFMGLQPQSPPPPHPYCLYSSHYVFHVQKYIDVQCHICSYMYIGSTFTLSIYSEWRQSWLWLLGVSQSSRSEPWPHPGARGPGAEPASQTRSPPGQRLSPETHAERARGPVGSQPPGPPPGTRGTAGTSWETPTEVSWEKKIVAWF